MSSIESHPSALLLCGGSGQRMREIAHGLPKPLMELGGEPLLLHIMAAVAQYGTTDFVLALGNGGQAIKDYFLHFTMKHSDMRLTLGTRPAVEYLDETIADGWQVSCVDTGITAGTGWRLRQAARHAAAWPLIVAYGDVVADVDVGALVRFHREHGRLATVTAVRPPGRFGDLSLQGTKVHRFAEKESRGWVSAGYFVIERAVVENYIPQSPDVMFENEPLSELARDGELMAYRHDGNWQSVDTPKELDQLQHVWDAGGWVSELWKGHLSGP